MSVEKVGTPQGVADEPSPRRRVVAASIGSFAECYEFAVYRLVAAFISYLEPETGQASTRMGKARR